MYVHVSNNSVGTPFYACYAALGRMEGYAFLYVTYVCMYGNNEYSAKALSIVWSIVL